MTFGIDTPPPADPVPQDRSPIAAAHRVDAASIAAVESALRDDADMRLWDMRLAAVLNTMDIARAHGEHRDWTNEHARQIRQMLAIADSAVVGDENAIVPSGFGPVVRTQLALTFIKAQAKAARPANGDAAGAEGGQR